MGKIVIIGSSNTDLVVRTQHIPQPGETVMGDHFMIAAGGKGANQAVAAKRLGGDVIFVAKLGRDTFGDNTYNSLVAEGFAPEFLLRDQTASSGVALINVGAGGENSIVVASGSNFSFTKEDIDNVADEIRAADIVLLQLEIPMDIVRYIVDIAYEAGVKVVLNPAPAALLDDDMLSKLYMVTPNETEVCGLCYDAGNDVEENARLLLSKGVRNVIVTLGECGSLIANSEASWTVPAYRVSAVDTTAAGDTFNGALCVALASGKALDDAVRFATKASAISVTRAGAQMSIPALDEVENFENLKL